MTARLIIYRTSPQTLSLLLLSTVKAISPMRAQISKLHLLIICDGTE